MKLARSRWSLCALALVGVGLMGWFVHAQDGQQPTTVGQTQPLNQDPTDLGLDAATLQSMKTMPWDQARALVESAHARATQALNDGQYAWAAAGFQAIAEALPASPAGADAWLMAEVAHIKAGNVAGAKAACDNVVSICESLPIPDYSNPGRYPQGMPFPPSLRDMLQRALRFKAELCVKAGQTEDAWAAIQKCRAVEPEYHFLRHLLPLQAQLQGVDAAALDAAEAEASKLSDEAKAAWWGEHDLTRALQLTDQVLSSYPETGAALLVRNFRAAMLWRKDRAQSRALYTENIRRLEPVAPVCDLVREARSKMDWSAGTKLIKDLIRRKATGQETTPDEFKRVREMSATVMAWEQEASTRVQANEIYITSLFWEGDYPGTVKAANEFLAQHAGPQQFELYGRAIAAAHVFTGDALTEMKRFPEALEQYRWVAQAQREKPIYSGDILGRVLYHYWYALHAAPGPAEERAAVAAEIRSIVPGSGYVQYMDMIEDREAQRNGK